jgi:basic amino acid/polyamine antiporter, APA family
MAQLKRALNLWQCIFFGVGSILGAGIYALVGVVAGWANNMLWLAFVLAAFTALFTAFSYAELSAAFPKSGGEYEYAKQAFGKRTGVVLGFLISANGIVTGATVALGFAGYLARLLPVPLVAGTLGIISLILIINAYGIEESSTVNVVCTIIEALGLMLVIYAALPSIHKANFLAPPERGMTGVLTAAALCFFAYVGFQDIVKLAEETRDPQKTIPKALFIANAIVVVIYVLVALCVTSAVAWQELSRSASPLAHLVNSRFGQAGAVTIAIIALFSTSNTILSTMLGSSRVLLNIFRESRYLHPLAHITPRHQTPVYALLTVFVFMGCFALIGKIEVIAFIANLFIYATFILVNLAVIVLRVRQAGLERPYRMPFTVGRIPLFPVLGIGLVLILMAYTVYALMVEGNS